MLLCPVSEENEAYRVLPQTNTYLKGTQFFITIEALIDSESDTATMLPEGVVILPPQ
jgi:hypothetical protein